jgi:hypothetical protein
MKALLAGWFSFEHMGATAGDLLARDVVCEWLSRAECPYDIALARPFKGGVDWTCVDPKEYSHLIFVCGPFGRSWQITSFLEHFSGCRMIGINLSMLESLEAWNPFDLLLERDSSRTARPDLSFLSREAKVPVVGVVLIDVQPEYGEQDVHQSANEAILSLVAARNVAAVRIDTRLDVNSTGLRTPAEIESLIARMDVVLTSRMHGLALSLKNGVPVVAVDPVHGGAKVKRQAETLRWPCIFTPETATRECLQRAYDFCLGDEARTKARACARFARASLAHAVEDFNAEFHSMSSDFLSPR